MDTIPNLEGEIVAKMVDTIKPMTEFVDWKSKEQIRSQIRVYISRFLQNYLPVRLSKQYAETILKLLLKPTSEYIKSEG